MDYKEKLESFKNIDYVKDGVVHNVYEDVKDMECIAYFDKIKYYKGDSGSVEKWIHDYFYFHYFGKFYGLLIDNKLINKKFNWKKFKFEDIYDIFFGAYAKLDIKKAIDFIFKFDKEIAKILSKRFIVKN